MNRIIWSTHLVILLVLIILALITDGIGGSGDSLVHYFISQRSWSDPKQFFDNWGKPFFTLFSSPFAQFGFTGIKIFNIICGLAASLLSAVLAVRLNKPAPWMIPILALVAPAFYTYLFSGLTEPFAALITIGAVYLCLTNRVAAGFILASFLGFCRTEAQAFLIFFLIFGILNGQWKKLPLLVTAYVLYAIAGVFVIENPWWMFNSPYDPGESIYGSGEWLHYPERLVYMLGLPAFILLLMGLIQFARRCFIMKDIDLRKEPLLIHGIFFTLLSGHALVWALGIYASAGLERTMIPVFPMIWLIMLDGISLLKDLSRRVFRRNMVLPLILLAWHLYYFFTDPVAKYYYSTIYLHEEERFMRDAVVPYIEKEFSNAERYAVDNPYFVIPLDIHFLSEQRVPWVKYHDVEQVSDEVVWIFDHRYVPMQYGITLEQIRKEGKLEEIKYFQGPNNSEFAVFVKQ